MTRVGLVLGAGGLVGQAFQAGVLSALESERGWDARTAEIIVGSSAGSLTGASLRLGVPAHDLDASAAGRPVSAEGEFLVTFAGEVPEIPPFEPRSLLHGWRPPPRQLIARAARRPWAFRPMAAASAMLPRGAVDLTASADTLAPHLGDGWPDGLWICAVRRDDGARVVFGRPGHPTPALGHAVAASCAIPGYFAPVEIDGVDYIDGGVSSPTNADVLRHEGLDLVIVVSSMSAAHGRAGPPTGAFRWAAHRRLEREVVRLRRNGTQVVRFEPAEETLEALGPNAMDGNRSAQIAEAARNGALAYAATPTIAERLALLPRA